MKLKFYSLLLFFLVANFSFAQEPVATFTTTATGTFNFSFFSNISTVDVDWGDGNGKITTALNAQNTTQGLSTLPSPNALTGTTTIKLYGDYITSLYLMDDDNTKKVSSVTLNSPHLEQLWCKGNQLTSLNLSNVPELRILSCWNNSLTSLNLSQLPKLIDINASQNPLSGIDLSQNPNLAKVTLEGIGLTSIDFSSNPNLTDVAIRGNPLTSLNLKNKTALKSLDTYGLPLTELDLTGCTPLIYLNCADNKLTSLVLPNDTLSTMDISGNRMTFATLPQATAVRNLPREKILQDSIQIALMPDGKSIDLRSYLASVPGLTASTVLSCFQRNADPSSSVTVNVSAGTYTNNNGIITFTTLPPRMIHFVFRNANFIGLNGSAKGGLVTKFIEITGIPTGIENNVADGISIYPNPFAEELTFKGVEGNKLRIVNLAGQTVYTQEINSEVETIRLDKLVSGAYIVYLTTPEGVKTSKIIKK